jgi:hypothetical protein
MTREPDRPRSGLKQAPSPMKTIALIAAAYLLTYCRCIIIKLTAATIYPHHDELFYQGRTGIQHL